MTNAGNAGPMRCEGVESVDVIDLRKFIGRGGASWANLEGLSDLADRNWSM